MGFFDHAQTAGKGMLQVAAVCAIGVVIARYPRPNPLLPASSLKVLSTLLSFVFAPAITIASFSTEMSLTLFVEAGYVALLSAFVVIGTGALIGMILARVAGVPPFFKKFFVMGSAFSNAFSVPVILLESIINSETSLRKDGEEEQEAFDRALVYLFSFLAVWQLLFWTAALSDDEPASQQPLLGSETGTSTAAGGAGDGQLVGTVSEPPDSKSQPPVMFPEAEEKQSSPTGVTVSRGVSLAALHPACASAQSKRVLPTPPTERPSGCSTRTKTILKRVFGTPPTIATILGLALGLTGAGRRVLFDDDAVFRFIGGAITLLGKPGVVLPSLVMSAGIVQGLARARAEMKRKSHTSPPSSPSPSPAPPDVSPPPVTVGQPADQHAPSAEPTAVVESHAVVVQVSGSSLASPPTPATDSYLITTRTAVWLIVSRLVVCPLVFFGLFLAAKSANLVPDDNLLQLTMLVQSAAPSPNFLMVVASMKGNARASASLAVTYIPMYCLSIVSMAVFVTWALEIVGPGS